MGERQDRHDAWQHRKIYQVPGIIHAQEEQIQTSRMIIIPQQEENTGPMIPCAELIKQARWLYGTRIYDFVSFVISI